MRDKYYEIISKFPKPTERQTINFIKMVAWDHSWYKHLSIERKEPFYFYLDPNAGRSLSQIVETGFFRKKKQFIFKDNQKNEYQAKFGLWQYYATNYTANYIPNDDGTMPDSRPFIGLNYIDLNGIESRLPQEVIDKGKFLASCYLHPNGYMHPKIIHIDDRDSYFEKHKKIMIDLREHLNSLLASVYT